MDEQTKIENAETKPAAELTDELIDCFIQEMQPGGRLYPHLIAAYKIAQSHGEL